MWYEIFLVIYLMWALAIFVGCLVGLAGDYEILIKTPKNLYKSTKMNWFGCIFIWLLEFLLNPIPWVAAAIYVGIHWLFTVGRKD